MSVEELRDRVSASGQKLYFLGAKIGVHPSTLSRVLKGQLPLRKEVGERLQRVLAELKA